MDSIKLERIEAFNVNETLYRPRPAPLTIVAAPLRAAHTAIKRRPAPPTHNNNQEPQHHLLPPTPIYPKVIPIFPTHGEVRLYEESMERSIDKNDDMPVGRALLPFNWPLVFDNDILATKSMFLKNLLRKIDVDKINYDLAVLCRDKPTEEALYNYFIKSNYTCIDLSYFAPNQQLFGIIFKFRESKQIKPVRSSYVDLIITYDSVYHQDYTRAMNYFSGTHRANPWITHLVDMGTPDAYVFNYNQTARRPIDMDMKMNSLDRVERSLFFKPSIHNSFSSWFDFISTHLWNWMKSKPTSDFVFVPPTKQGPLLDEYMRFNLVSSSAPITPARPNTVHPGVASTYRPDHRSSSPRQSASSSRPATSTKRMREESAVVESPSKHKSKEKIGTTASNLVPPNRTISASAVDAVNKFLDKASTQASPVVDAPSGSEVAKFLDETLAAPSTAPTSSNDAAEHLDEPLAPAIDPIDRAIAQALEAPADTYNSYPPTDTMDVSDVGTSILSYAVVNDQVHQDSNTTTSTTTTPTEGGVGSSRTDKSTATSLGVKMDDFLARALQQFEKDIEALKNQL